MWDVNYALQWVAALQGAWGSFIFSCRTESRYSLCEAHFSGTEVGVGPKDWVLDGLTLQEEKSRKALVFKEISRNQKPELKAATAFIVFLVSINSFCFPPLALRRKAGKKEKKKLVGLFLRIESLSLLLLFENFFLLSLFKKFISKMQFFTENLENTT